MIVGVAVAMRMVMGVVMGRIGRRGGGLRGCLDSHGKGSAEGKRAEQVKQLAEELEKAAKEA